MPRLEELECYFRGLWLLLTGRVEGFDWLDFSSRGFWRSWWAILYCLPPTVLSWVAFRASYLSVMPQGTKAGANFFSKLAVIEVSNWIMPTVILMVIANAAGLSRMIIPLIITTNWLSVPLQWIYAVQNIIQLLLPDSDIALALLFLVFMMSSLVAHFLIISRVLGGDRLASSTIVLALFVSSYFTQYQLMNFFELWVS
ncbi:MAG: putative transrane protein [Rhizobium sp.]|nr:putative transrane protein [Rhizobium sp.]